VLHAHGKHVSAYGWHPYLPTPAAFPYTEVRQIPQTKSQKDKPNWRISAFIKLRFGMHNTEQPLQTIKYAQLSQSQHVD
jgi:hypothetical protein